MLVRIPQGLLSNMRKISLQNQMNLDWKLDKVLVTGMSLHNSWEKNKEWKQDSLPQDSIWHVGEQQRMFFFSRGESIKARNRSQRSFENGRKLASSYVLVCPEKNLKNKKKRRRLSCSFFCSLSYKTQRFT